ncbi:MAG: hypothetical protein CMG74_11340 [Candidatus Marinimicrobia bacterium]|nr:hypothetical protein [Candidatus Neomarinimicrobiota bacterium]|tara:strand:+ start:30438 stop:31505 length:1068 start_codon:yes stop_codon:yes gene_type:complete
MDVYYFANQVYEFSFSRPIYERIGGVFVVNKYSRLLRFKKYLRNGNSFPDMKRNFLNTPAVIKKDIKKPIGLKGIIISQSNTTINCENDDCIKIFMGHGTGDKKYGGAPTPLETYDYHFISGQKHLQKLNDLGVNIPEEKQIKIGYPKFDEYVNGQTNHEEHLNHLGIKDRNRKNILYAPTWKWGNGTLQRYVYKFCRDLTNEFNLIIRPHFFERKFIPFLKAWTKINRINHVYFSNPANILKNTTLNDFAVSDILISDTSSILYEYLITLKPIIIVESDYTNLHNMPDTMDINCLAKRYNDSSNLDILEMVNDSIEKEDKYKDYHTLLNNCFYYNDGKSTERAIKFLSSFQKLS